MTRKFAKIDEKKFISKVETKFKGDYGLDPHIIGDYLDKDLKVMFDYENFETQPNGYTDPNNPILGVHTLDNGLTFWGMCAGGDWEEPVFFIVYWDGKRLRGYVPTDGNTFNTDTMMAYGNGYEDDDEESKDAINKKNRYPELGNLNLSSNEIEETFMGWDANKILNDIKTRIMPAELDKESKPRKQTLADRVKELEEKLKNCKCTQAGA